MQANEFEKEIRDKMLGLEMAAGEEVWPQVSARINQRKKRRKLLIFWLAACLLALTLGGWWMTTQPASEKMSGQVKTEAAENEKPGNNTPAILDYDLKTTRERQGADKKLLKTLAKTNHKAPVPALLKKHPAATAVKPVTGTNYAAITKVKTATAVVQTSESVTQPATVMKPKTTYQAQQTLPLHRFYHPEIDSVVPLAVKETLPAKDTVVFAGMKSSSKPSISNWKIGFTLYTGIANNISALLASGEKSYSRAADAVTGQIPSGNNNNPDLPALTYQPGLSFGAGVSVARQVARQLSVAAGIDYHFLSSRSKTGTKVLSPSSLYDSTLSLSADYSYYYRQGESYAYTNKYHLLQAPIILQYQLNQNQQKLVSLFAGIVPGYIFSSQVLYANRSQGIYYEEKRQLNRFQLSGSAGLLFTLLQIKPFSLAAGPVAQYSFTNLTKAVVSNNQHLFFAGVKANFTLR